MINLLLSELSELNCWRLNVLTFNNVSPIYGQKKQACIPYELESPTETL